MLSYTTYGWLCVLGGEVFYVVCMLYANLLSGAALELHNSLFELLPGFVWGTTSSVVYGALYVFAFSWIFALYYVWMHNTSLVSKK